MLDFGFRTFDVHLHLHVHLLSCYVRGPSRHDDDGEPAAFALCLALLLKTWNLEVLAA